MLTDDELRALADALEPMAQLERHGSPGALALESTVDYLRACADAEPTGYFGKSAVDGVLIEMEPWATNAIPLYAHPAPAAPQAEPRPCTCHPDDNPPVPCAQKYALSECRAVSGEPTEAQIVAAAKWLDDRLPGYISRTAFASGVLRAALAAK